MKKTIRLTERDLVKLVNRVLSEQSNQDLTRPTQDTRGIANKLKPQLVGKNVSVNFRPSNSEEAVNHTVRIVDIQPVEADFNKLANPLANQNQPDLALPNQIKLITDDLTFRENSGIKNYNKTVKNFEIKHIYFGCTSPNSVSVYDDVRKYRIGTSKQIQDFLNAKLDCSRMSIRRDVDFEASDKPSTKSTGTTKK